MRDSKFNVLFLCTGNSARSIMAEALMNYLGVERFHAYSAGSHPAGRVNPLAIKVLEQMGQPTNRLRSKSWDEFSKPDAPPLDFVLTVCDKAAHETCPVWIGRPLTAHWGLPDPASAKGSESDRMQAFKNTYRQLEIRIKKFSRLLLGFGSLDCNKLKQYLDEIGQSGAGGTTVTRHLGERWLPLA